MSVHNETPPSPCEGCFDDRQAYAERVDTTPAATNLECQLYDLAPAGSALPAWKEWFRRLRKLRRYMVRNTVRVLRQPSIIGKKLKELVASPQQVTQEQQSGNGRSLRLNLQPGERVRVKPMQEILETLDERGCFERMGFMYEEMGRFCGGVYTVRKRIDRFFDERNQRLLKLRNVVILEEVFCEPSPASSARYAGCARTCFLFWKEAWLERADDR